MEIEYVKLWQCRWSASGVRRSSNQHQQQPVADEPQNGTSDMYVRSRSFFLPHCSLSPCVLEIRPCCNATSFEDIRQSYLP